MEKKILVVLLGWLPFLLFSQKDSTQIKMASGFGVNTIRPVIVVVPFTKEGEDLRTIIESDFNKRIAVAKIKEAFDTRGYTTKDFITLLKGTTNNSLYASDNQSDFKTKFLQNTGADIYVEVDMNVNNSATGTGVTLILAANETSTFLGLSNKTCESGKFYTDDIPKLVSKAADSGLEPFLNVLQEKFTDIVNNGKTILLDVGFSQGSSLNTSSEIGQPVGVLSDKIEDWVSSTAVKNNYNLQGITDVKMVFSDIRIPLKDETGKNFTTNKYCRMIRDFLKSQGVVSDVKPKLNTVYVTIK
jgi:hypothetical protein